MKYLIFIHTNKQARSHSEHHLKLFVYSSPTVSLSSNNDHASEKFVRSFVNAPEDIAMSDIHE